ncbi:MAG: TetR/AcrR family transcriptional regulator [Candidatus Binatia bacterium]
MPAVAHELSPREKILEAAEALFARRGFSGVGLSEIAEVVGVSKSSLFHHFATKAQLHAAVVERILAEIEAALVRTLAAGGTPIERLDRWIDTLIDLLGEQPAHARLLMRSMFEDDELSGTLDEERAANQTLARIIESASHLLREGMAQGQLRVASIPHLLQSLIGMLIYHFASGDFGAEMLGRPVFAPAEVRRRKDEVKALIHHGLVTPAASRKGA